MVQGKNEYKNIEIPDDLTEIRLEAEKKASHHRRSKIYLKSLSAVAAFAIVFILCNVQTTYAALVKIPVLGSLVQVFHIGSGGERTDGVSLDAKAGNETLILHFRHNKVNTETAPAYEIQYLHAPNRVVITLNGVREFNGEEFKKEAMNLKSIRYAYSEIVLDDSMIRVVLELKEGIGYKAEEYKDPGTLNLKFAASENADEEIYFVRTPSMEMGEELSILTEIFSDGYIVRTQEDKYCFTLGSFTTEEEAINLKKKLEDAKLSDIEFTVEHCKASANPM